STLDPKEMLIRNPLLALFRCRYIFLNDRAKTILTLPAMPRVVLVEDWLVMREPEEIFRKIMEPGFDPRKTVILHSAPNPLPEGSGRPGSVSVLRSSTDWLEIEADLPRPAILLVTDAYSSHWRVRSLSSGAPQARYELLSADYVLRAVPLSAGRHHLLMEYRPLGFEIGKWISLISLIVFAGLGLGLLRRR
ncbi:MAG: hypothetical protein ABL955_10555, partial [Elusimicrobiota bacterium]